MTFEKIVCATIDDGSNLFILWLSVYPLFDYYLWKPGRAWQAHAIQSLLFYSSDPVIRQKGIYCGIDWVIHVEDASCRNNIRRAL